MGRKIAYTNIVFPIAGIILTIMLPATAFLYSQSVKLERLCEKIDSIESKISTGFNHTDREVTRIKDHLAGIARECCSELYSKADNKKNGG